MPCSGRCGESKCPQLCLATEVSLNAILNFMLVKYDLRNWQSEFAISTYDNTNGLISHIVELVKINMLQHFGLIFDLL